MVQPLPYEAYTRYGQDEDPEGNDGQQRPGARPRADPRSIIREHLHSRQVPQATGDAKVSESIKDHFGTAVRRVFVAALMADGRTEILADYPRNATDSHVAKFFDPAAFADAMKGSLEAGDPFGGYIKQQSRMREFGSLQPPEQHPMDESPDLPKPRGKRIRIVREVENLDNTPPHITRRGCIQADDDDGTWKVYERGFKDIQQQACKIIAKAWVKAIEPKKQSTHPYTGSDEKAPDWWPKPWGPLKDDKVRHKEPDHLYKKERVHLLCHILRLVIEPVSRQHPTIRKLGLNVRKLEELTEECLGPFCLDNEPNSSRVKSLFEVFQVAKHEESYRNGEIDGSTQLFILAPDSNLPMNNDTNPTSDDEKETSQSLAEDGAKGAFHHRPGVPRPGNVAKGGSEAKQDSIMSMSEFVGNLPAKHTKYGPSAIPASLFQAQEPDSPPQQRRQQLDAPEEMMSSPPTHSRRASTFGDYSGPPNSGIYSHHWHAATPSSPPEATSMYHATQLPPIHIAAEGPEHRTEPYSAGQYAGAPRTAYQRHSGGPLYSEGMMHSTASHHPREYDYTGNHNRAAHIPKSEAAEEPSHHWG